MKAARLCWGCVAPPRQEVSYVIVLGVWRNFLDDLVFALVLWSPCCISGIVCALLVDFRWSVKTSLRRGVPEEQDVALVGVPWPLPSGLASGPWGVLIAHFRLKLPHPRSGCDLMCVVG